MNRREEIFKKMAELRGIPSTDLAALPIEEVVALYVRASGLAEPNHEQLRLRLKEHAEAAK